jgi:hypothetical protein
MTSCATNPSNVAYEIFCRLASAGSLDRAKANPTKVPSEGDPPQWPKLHVHGAPTTIRCIWFNLARVMHLARLIYGLSNRCRFLIADVGECESILAPGNHLISYATRYNAYLVIAQNLLTAHLRSGSFSTTTSFWKKGRLLDRSLLSIKITRGSH